MNDRKVIYLDDAIDALEKVAMLFPYRIPGNRDTYDRYNEAWNDAIGRAEMALEVLPSVQPEIVRCKGCKHYDGRPCGIVDWYNTEDDFCSRAERREE